MTIVFTASFFIKKHTYKLLINQGKFRFNEIKISKFNCSHAENFALNFKNGKLTNKSTSETIFQQLKEAL
jgi:hypothetical protein